MSSTHSFPDLWNILHDGGISAITGTVPGMVSLHVDIRYLADRIAGAKTGFDISLICCTHLKFKPFDGSMPLEGPAAMASEELEILSAEMSGAVCSITCVEGILEVTAADTTIQVHDNRVVTLQELRLAAESYWKDFAKRKA